MGCSCYGKNSHASKHKATRSWKWCSGQRHNPNPEISTKSVSQKSIQPYGGTTFKNYGADQQRLQISELHFHKFPTPQTFSVWKTRFKTEMCSCSNFLAEMVNSVDDLKSSCSIQRVTPFPDVFVLDAGIASALNKIIQKYCKKKVSLEEQRFKKKTDSFEEDRSPTWSTITFGSLASTIPYLFMPTYLRLFFGMTTFRSSIRDGMKFYCQWSNFQLDDILESLYKLRIRESEKIKTVLELYNLEIHQEKAKPDYHRLMTRVKRGIEQHLRARNVEARNGRIESHILAKNQRE